MGNQYGKLKDMYGELKQKINEYDCYNLVEKGILEVELEKNDWAKVANKEQFDSILHCIKSFAMEVSRSMPSQWNNFMDVILMQ